MLLYPFLEVNKSRPGQERYLLEGTQLGRARARSCTYYLPPEPEKFKHAKAPWCGAVLGLWGKEGHK